MYIYLVKKYLHINLLNDYLLHVHANEFIAYCNLFNTAGCFAHSYVNGHILVLLIMCTRVKNYMARSIIQ